MININAMPLNTRYIFEELSKAPMPHNALLCGDTGLALRLNHRKSEDLDFMVSSDTLSSAEIYLWGVYQ